MTTKERILDLVAIFQAHPYSLVFFGLVACGLGLPFPEEFFLVMSGFVSYKSGVTDVAGLVPMFLVTWLAIGGGDTLTFFIGRRLGPRVFETSFLRRLVSPAGVAKAESFLITYGSKTIMAARFLPGIRMPTYLLCGTLKVPFSTFIFFDGLAMLVSVPTQVYLTWRYGAVLDEALVKIARLNKSLFASAVVVVLVIYIRIHSGGSSEATPQDIDAGAEPAAPTQKSDGSPS